MKSAFFSSSQEVENQWEEFNTLFEEGMELKEHLKDGMCIQPNGRDGCSLVYSHQNNEERCLSVKYHLLYEHLPFLKWKWDREIANFTVPSRLYVP